MLFFQAIFLVLDLTVAVPILPHGEQRWWNLELGKVFCLMKHHDIFLPAEVDQGRPPIKVKFEIPYFTVSGIQVTYCKLLLLVSF